MKVLTDLKEREGWWNVFDAGEEFRRARGLAALCRKLSPPQKPFIVII